MSQRQSAHFNARRRQRGTTMIEVLVAIIIVVIGLLGLAGLQARINLAEMEAFQRAQGIVLLQDMVDRINANRKNAAKYVTASPLGADEPLKDCSALHLSDRDLCEWSNALLGAGESSGGLKVGAMIGARGCIQNTVAVMPQQYLVSIVWQGLNPTVKPTATDCGAGLYGDEATRRTLTTTVIVGCLENNPAGGCIVTAPPPPVF
jgi:type IV pilus assembly protein PilV